jgi:hypothetical protein
MNYGRMLDDAMYNGMALRIKTTGRGEIIGVPDMVDDFISDPNRLGYQIRLTSREGEYEVDTVFLDEITAISLVALSADQLPAGAQLAV